MNDIQTVPTVCPVPHNMACRHVMGRLDARYTNATAADVTAPQVAGVITPMINTNTGKNLKPSQSNKHNLNPLTHFPILCLRRVATPISAAIV